MKIAIVDTYYPDVIKALPVDGSLSYEENLSKILSFSFGTADFWSRNLRAHDWNAIDIIANHSLLQALWSGRYWDKVQADILLRGNSYVTWSEILAEQMRQSQPDVVFLQDLSLADQFAHPRNFKLAGQLSCPWPGDSRVQKLDCIFSSFPHYVPRIQALGVKAVFNPLGFDPVVLNRARFNARGNFCSFVGGVGAPSHWQYGLRVLEAVASHIPEFLWWGYGADSLPRSPLRDRYQGEAWGLEMYEILLRSGIVLNRHGEVAGSFCNNMRMFEVTGCGALLVTEAKDNIRDYFAKDEVVTYTSPEDAAEKIRFYLDHPIERGRIASRGQSRTLRDHTYERRMKTISDTLKAML